MSTSGLAGAEIGIVGLGVMGQNLALNVSDKGFSCSVWDAWSAPVDAFEATTKQAKADRIHCFRDLAQFVASLRRPRRIVLLVKAGSVVDDTIAALRPMLEPGDMVIDSGNEFFENTERRAKELALYNVRFFGMGISGGEEGARHGPSLMPGGDRAGYDDMAPLLSKVAAQADGPCVTYCGTGGAGHYVKMVHNGIEYGDMQLIAEAYSLLKYVGGLSNSQIADVFESWNQQELQSYLIEITAEIFRRKDDETDADLIDMIVDAAAAKGTGAWTVQDAARLGVAASAVASSVEARILSADRATREFASERLAGPQSFGRDGALPAPSSRASGAAADVIADTRAALYAAKACSYAQGMNLLRVASSDRAWGINLGEIARIWKGGCIIRAKFLGRIQEAFARDPHLPNLLLDEGFTRELSERQTPWRRTIVRAVEQGIPVATLSATLGYYDALRRKRLPANLTQAQRDYFGAHTFERIDRPGKFHANWRKKN